MTDNHEVPNPKDFLAQMGPIETLLGSLSYNDIDNVDGKTQQLRTSARVFKKMKFDLSSVEKKVEKKEEVKPEEKQEVKKPANPFWSSEEKNLFFEALNEYGKDFESIHGYISTRLKKKGVPEDLIKNKLQVRHFYYKTFHMLLGPLKFNEKIPKNVQELYTLINFGEMRRKLGSISKKNCSKLNDLIANGSVPLRLKGKTVRVKTPMCRALRRLNQLDEKYDDLKLPTRVLVELRPKNMASFLRVQSVAQNPRIKVALSLQKRLSSLITCINTRWKTSEAVVYDKAVISTNPVTKNCVPDTKTIDDSTLLLNPLLRLSPPPEAHIELPSIDISEYFNGQSISLNAFELRKGVKKEEPEAPPKTEKSPNKPDEEEIPKSVTSVVDEAVNTILSLQVQNKTDTKTATTTNPKDIPNEEKISRIEQIKQGWTLENCASLTIGEIYLMYGCDSKMVLEYSWDCLIKSNDETKQENDLTNSLKKLLSLAKIQSEKPVMKCTCGHVCGKPSTQQFKKPVAPKVVKQKQVSHETNHVQEKVEVSEPKPAPEPKKAPPEEPFHDTSSSVVHLFSQRDKFRIKGRTRFKHLVVERKLVPNKSENKHEIVSMDIVSQDKPDDMPLVNSSGLPSMLMGDNDTRMSEKSFSFLGDNQSNSAMSTGLSKILKENENQWINADVADYSLSSLLGHLDCPSKTNQSMVSLSHDDTQLSQDVDAQLRTLLIETSVDYTAKFADLAAQVVENKK
ncbi:protein cramped isoform X2 [Tribolium castaneum]|uniref:protein cramped isoform X2 n=1 Tax=Tribolium castaneum TaxID=7070 RepID=UPI00046C0FC5|nr:PREDICTED: protein cramped isoform X2 [Tribolium castaneum]|eukprot:XP_008192098.1 PREDICTED: protein cramped isoform X2 [Tribolium castaneum]